MKRIISLATVVGDLAAILRQVLSDLEITYIVGSLLRRNVYSVKTGRGDNRC